MAEEPTIEELERRLDALCAQYLRKTHTKEMQREIIDLVKRVDELKAKRKVKPKRKGKRRWKKPSNE